MNHGILSGCKNLSECEEVLSKLVHPGELLGRIPLSKSEWNILGNAFKKIISKLGESDGSRKIWVKYPNCAAVYLVYAGINLYEAGQFWPALKEIINISGNTTTEWGQHFIAFLEKHKLPTFADTGGLKYITPILGHGGIPNYCLTDFFKYILSKAMSFTGLSGEELLDELINDTSYFTFTDKPIQRFLTNGGELAADFITRCIEMAQQSKCDGLSEPELFGLPSRIVEQYKKWVKESSVIFEKSYDYLRSPSIRYEPYGLGVIMYLPSQKLNSNVCSITWQISSDKGFFKEIHCSPWKSGKHVIIPEEEVPLNPSNCYEISLIISGEQFGKWVFTNSEDKPYLAFNPDTGRLQRFDNLHGQEIWLILKREWEISNDEVRIMEEFPPIDVSWRDYKAFMVDFESSTILELSTLNGETFSVPIINKFLKPKLVGGKAFAKSERAECLIYTNELPSVRLPLPPKGQESVNWWNRWTIVIHNDGDSEPEIFKISNYMENLIKETSFYLLPLDIPELLMGKVGYRKLVIRGPLGYDASLECIILPDIEFRYYFEHYWPVGYKGYSSSQFSFVIPKPYNISLLNQDCNLLETKDLYSETYYLGELSANATSISGNLHCGLNRSYRFYKNVRPLKWGWLGLGSSGTVDWQSSVVKVSVEEWEANPEVTLVLYFENEEYVSKINGEISLKNKIGKDYYTINFTLGKNRYLKFPLARWKDTVYQHEFPLYRLWLKLYNGQEIITEVCLAEIIRDWQVSNIKILPEDRWGHEFTKCYVCWEENFNITNKVLKIWKLWRPWEEPITFEVDNKDCNVLINLSSNNLAPGIYRFELAKVNEIDEFSEEPQSEQFPQPGEALVRDVKIKLKEWNNYIVGLSQTPTVSRQLERYLALSSMYDNIQEFEWEMPEKILSIEEVKQIIMVCKILANETDNCNKVINLLNLLQPSLKEINTLTMLKVIAQMTLDGILIDKNIVSGLGLDLLSKNVDLYSHLEDWESQALWSYWPALGFLTDINAGNYNALYSKMIEYFGRTGLEEFFKRPLKGP